MLVYLYQIFIFLLGHFPFFLHFFFVFMENLFKIHPIHAQVSLSCAILKKRKSRRQRRKEEEKPEVAFYTTLIAPSRLETRLLSWIQSEWKVGNKHRNNQRENNQRRNNQRQDVFHKVSLLPYKMQLEEEGFYWSTVQRRCWTKNQKDLQRQ